MAIGIPAFPQEATFFSRRLWEKIGLFDERLSYGFDTAFYARALGVADKVLVTRVPLGVMHVHPLQKTLRQDDKKMIEDRIFRIEYHPKISVIHKMLLRLYRTRFAMLADAILRLLVFRKARSKFLIAGYDAVTGKWQLSSF